MHHALGLSLAVACLTAAQAPLSAATKEPPIWLLAFDQDAASSTPPQPIWVIKGKVSRVSIQTAEANAPKVEMTPATVDLKTLNPYLVEFTLSQAATLTVTSSTKKVVYRLVCLPDLTGDPTASISGPDRVVPGDKAILTIKGLDPTLPPPEFTWSCAQKTVEFTPLNPLTTEVTIKPGTSDPIVVSATIKGLPEGTMGPIEHRMAVGPEAVLTPSTLGRASYSFTAGQSFTREGGDFSRKDAYFAFTADLNLRDFLPGEIAIAKKENQDSADALKERVGQGRLFGQLDLRLTPVHYEKDGKDALSEKKSGTLDLKLYQELPSRRTLSNPNRIKGFDPMVAVGIRTGVQSVPDAPQMAHHVAAMVRLNLMERRGPFLGPNIWGYIELGAGYWSQYEAHKRIYLEARLSIPKTPIVFGVDANCGEKTSDLRVLMALRADLNTFLSNLGFNTK